MNLYTCTNEYLIFHKTTEFEPHENMIKIELLTQCHTVLQRKSCCRWDI